MRAEPFLDRLIDLALEEDLGPGGDVTTTACVPPGTRARGHVRAKERLVLCGMGVLDRVCARVDPALSVEVHHQDGEGVEPGTVVATVTGPAHALLVAERPALNFLMRLSGIATQARTIAQAVVGTKTQVVDTRKTTPGWRALEKHAVRVGGCGSHRMGLFDGVLIKDNHITAAGGIEQAVIAARASAHHLLRIEVEAATLAQLDQCLALGVDAVLLDNMDDATLAEAVKRTRAHEQKTGARVLLEVSGNMTIERLPRVAATGVDLVSMGALTHQATSVDLSMKIELLP
jgi:nicotinate-nucleotide pyrophosphorylase (carboxylating)